MRSQQGSSHLGNYVKKLPLEILKILQIMLDEIAKMSRLSSVLIFPSVYIIDT